MMGGVAHAVGDIITEGAEKIGGHLTDYLGGAKAASEAKNIAKEFLYSQASEFQRTPNGISLMNKVGQYDMKRNQILTQLNKPVELLDAGIKDKPKAMRSTIGDLHQEYTQTNHPDQKYTKQLLDLDPEHGQRTLLEVNQIHRKQASLAAQKQVFGENNEHVVSDIMELYDSPDPTMHSHADAMLNSLAVHFHDTTAINGAAASQTKLDVKKALTAESKYREAMGLSPLKIDPEKFNTTNVYGRTNAIEQLAGRRARQFLAPLIAINHISTFFNNAWAPLTALGKAMATYGDKDLQDLVFSSGILGSQMHHIIDRDLRARTGFFAKMTGSPKAGDLIDQVFHTPGFDQMRNLQLKFSGLVGYHATTEWAAKAMEGDKRAIAELTEMKLPVQDIIKAGGKLTDDQYRQAIWHYANNRMFIEKQLDRSLMSRKTAWSRMLTMFHGYVTNQQRFMRNELVKMWRAKDYAGIARFAGTVGIIFPAVAPMIKSLEVLGRTGSPTQAGQGFTQDYKTLADMDHPVGAALEYLDLLSYFGTWGTLHSYIQAAHSDRLALALMGPIPATVVRTTQDAINYATKPSKSGERNIRPLAKDVLQQTVPIAGNIAAAQLFPKKGQ
jgi:hypothetical protein